MKDIQRILIVNDDRKVAARLAARLKIAGYSTAVAANFEGGKAQMTNEPSR